MKDLFINILLDISENSEKKTSRIVIKALHYLTCTIISIWIAEQHGFKMTPFNFSLELLTSFFADLTIVVPVLILIFVIAILSVCNRLLAITASQLITLIAFLTYFKRQSVLIHLLNEKVIDKDLKKAENFNSYTKNLNLRKKIVSENYLQTNYYSLLLLAIWLIYNQIVPDKFPTLHFKWINIGLTIWTCLNLFTVGFFLFFKKKVDEIERNFRLIRL